MSESSRDKEFNDRLIQVEKEATWLRERVWTGPGNLHDRVHTLEDKRISDEMERTTLKEDLQKIEQVLGINGTYGTRNIITDLRDAVDSIANLKGNVITTKDFQSFIHKLDQLEKRDQAKLTFYNVVQLSIVTAAINILINMIASSLIP